MDINVGDIYTNLMFSHIKYIIKEINGDTLEYTIMNDYYTSTVHIAIFVGCTVRLAKDNSKLAKLFLDMSS